MVGYVSNRGRVNANEVIEGYGYAWVGGLVMLVGEVKHVFVLSEGESTFIMVLFDSLDLTTSLFLYSLLSLLQSRRLPPQFPLFILLPACPFRLYFPSTHR